MEIVITIVSVVMLAAAYIMLFSSRNVVPAEPAEPAETQTDIQV